MGNFSKIIGQDKPVLVDFFAEWCGPCKMMAPILKEVKDEMGDQVTILKVDVDKNQPLAARHQIKGVPTLIIFRKSKIVWKQSGVVSKIDILSKLKESSK